MSERREVALEFEYDSLDSYQLLKTLFDKANYAFLRNEAELIDSEVAERTLCGAFKTHFEKLASNAGIKGYYVDVEYNRNNGQIKTILDENMEIISIQCDLILHSRGHNVKQDNLVALEMKKSYRDEESKNSDRMRLRALTKSSYNNDIWSYDGTSLPKRVCRYILGVYYEVDVGNRFVLLEYYKGGEMVGKKKIFYGGRIASRFIKKM